MNDACTIYNAVPLASNRRGIVASCCSSHCDIGIKNYPLLIPPFVIHKTMLCAVEICVHELLLLASST